VNALAGNAQVVALFNGLVRERAGLHHPESAHDLFATKLADRALEAGFESLMDYYYFLRYDDASGTELDALVDALVVNETYFFREAGQLRVLVEDVLAPRVAEGLRPRIWSAACASGEEPYTLAMMLAERNMLGSVDLIASDISPRMLARAREGDYSARSQRAMPPAAMRHFTYSGERARINAEIKEAVTFRLLNLVEGAAVSSFRNLDAVVCRNVLIYFDDATVVRVVESLADALRPGGYLLVGASESLLRFGTSLTCEERRGEFLYRKQPAGASAVRAQVRPTFLSSGPDKPLPPRGST
jgi:chemotaxis protein methyltransferase CheR